MKSITAEQVAVLQTMDRLVGSIRAMRAERIGARALRAYRLTAEICEHGPESGRLV